MKVNRLRVENFTAFEKAELDFCDGVNVLIGANATGKTHLLKASYSALNLLEDPKIILPDTEKDLDDRSLYRGMELIAQMFRLEERHLLHLRRSSSDSERGKIELLCSNGEVKIGIDAHAPKGLPSIVISSAFPRKASDKFNSLFLPSREVLSMYEGFVQAYEKRELSFDRTFYDLCKALGAGWLREQDHLWRGMIESFERTLGGKVVLKGNRFYVKSQVRSLQADLVAEGHRKLAMLVQLMGNGSIGKNTILLWDEPEANLNPMLITEMALIIRKLASLGVQLLLASHDYLLTSELSMAAEYQTKPKVPIRFFAFSKKSPDGPVTVQTGDTLPHLDDNPILEEFAAHYDREHAEMAKSLKGRGCPS